MTTQALYRQWRDNPYFDDAFRAELEALEGQGEEIEDRFYRDLKFGTAGMRGIIGAGRNRMNRYVVRRATQGFANFLLHRRANVLGASQDTSIAIAYDSRHMSYEFAEEAARVMAGNGIRVYLFDEVRPTPELSFAVRALKCMGGIVITASHNPPQYNGYKVYDEEGCQLVPHLAERLVDAVNEIKDFESVKCLTRQEAVDKGLFKIIHAQMDTDYVDMVKNVSIHPEYFATSPLKVVYTPLHGTGGHTVSRVMKELAFSGLIPVESQMAPDGDFPTCKQPNPEALESFEYALETAKKYDADLIIATDPDCDRMGLMIKSGRSYTLLSGNQIGALFMEYVLSAGKPWGPDHYVINTVVSSDIAKAQAEAHGVQLIQTLTGFKFIGAQIKEDYRNFIMAYEESYGYLFDPHVRDKDGVMATLMAIEMAEHYRLKGQSLSACLEDIYNRYGAFAEETVSKMFEGKEGGERMQAIMAHFRKHPETLLPGARVIDFKKKDTGFPVSDVLKFYVDAHSWVVLRPSGTEPKLKVYYSIRGTDMDAAWERLKGIKETVESKVLGE